MKIECLRQLVVSGGKTYPIYMGFASADEISRVAVAPAFNVDTPNQQIAENISHKPVRDWQRPLSDERVTQIADTFDDTGGLMPNPVLLAKNAFTSGITISPKQLPNAPYATGTFEIDVPDNVTNPVDRPLWILDGQHRIAGLSKSKQANDAVPLVLLLDDGTGSYTSPLLANLFAQVTTAATKLDELHNEWLTFAFTLGRYAPSKSGSVAADKAFRSVVELCRASDWGSDPNPFFNQVQFNEHVSVKPTLGGFAFTCKHLADLVARYYYAKPSQAGHRAEASVAQELSSAYRALHETITNHNESVFFGGTGKQQTIVQEAFFAGVLARTASSGPTVDYKALFQDLQFHTTNWEFNWVRSLSGPANTASKKIVREVFEDALRTGHLPAGSNNLADHLKGNGASVTLACSSLTPGGKAAKAGRTLVVAERGSTRAHSIANTPHVRLVEKTTNVGEVHIFDAHVVGRQQRYREIERAGLIVATPLPRPLDLVITMQHYGDQYSQAEVQLNW